MSLELLKKTERAHCMLLNAWQNTREKGIGVHTMFAKRNLDDGCSKFFIFFIGNKQIMNGPRNQNLALWRVTKDKTLLERSGNAQATERKHDRLCIKLPNPHAHAHVPAERSPSSTPPTAIHPPYNQAPAACTRATSHPPRHAAPFSRTLRGVARQRR